MYMEGQSKGISEECSKGFIVNRNVHSVVLKGLKRSSFFVFTYLYRSMSISGV